MTHLPLRAVALAAALACSLLLGACSKENEATLLASAQAMLAKDDTKGAVIQLKTVLQQNPDSAEARYLLGKTLLASGDAVAALVELRKARMRDYDENKVVPELARAMLFGGEADKVLPQFASVVLTEPLAAAELKTTLASALASNRQFDKARQTIDDALRLAPGHVPALVLLAQIEGSTGEVESALKTLDTVLAADPGQAAAGVLKGNILLQAKQDGAGATAAYKQVLAAHPNTVAAHSGLLEVLFREGRVDDARAALATLKKIAPAHPETQYYEAQLAFTERRYKEARELIDPVLKVLPENVRVLELAGLAEFRLRQYLQAEALLSHALQNAPQQLATRQMLAQTHLRAGQPGKAVEVLKPVLQSAAPDGGSLALAGEAYLQMGDNARSDDAFKRALKAAPSNAAVRTSAAMAQLAAGRSAAAVSELESIVAGDSGPRADLALISALLRQNDVAGALKAIDGLEKKLPQDPLAPNLRGRVLLTQKDLAGARSNFAAALKKDPYYFPAIASLAAIELQEGKIDVAKKRFEELLKAQPRNYRAMLALAELGVRTGAPAAQTLDLLRQATKLDPTAPTPHLMLIDRLLATRDHKAALVAAQDAKAAVPTDFAILDALGRTQIAAGDPQSAISTFKDLTSQQPTNAQHELRLADAYLAAKDKDGATAALRRALRLKPDLAVAKRGLATLAMIDKRPQDALAIAQEMQKSDPKNAAGWVLEGEIEAARQNWDGAANAYRQVMQRTQVSDAPQRLHSALLAGGKKAEAERVAADWLKNHSKDSSFYYYLGDMALARNDLSEAEAQYRKVLNLQPKNALALNNVAWLLAKQGKPGGVPMAQEAAALLPGNAPMQDTLSFTLETDNQIAPAIEAQRRAVAMAPEDGKLGLRLAKLYLKQGDKDRARAELEVLAKRGDRFAQQAEVESLLKTL